MKRPGGHRFSGLGRQGGPDAYGVHPAFRSRRGGAITLAGCWAHARRGFREALEIGEHNDQSALMLHQVQWLYEIERRLRQSRAGRRGRALTGLLGHWKRLMEPFLDEGLEIDITPVENAIRPRRGTARLHQMSDRGIHFAGPTSICRVSKSAWLQNAPEGRAECSHGFQSTVLPKKEGAPRRGA